MASLRPSELAALKAAAAAPDGRLQRRPGGYRATGATGTHSARAVYALERERFLECVEPGLPSLVHITESGRRAVEAFRRAEAIAGVRAG